MKTEPEFIIRKVRKEEVKALRDIAKETFVRAFGAMNNPDDLAMYIEASFNESAMLDQLTHPDSIFYFVVSGKKVIGYLKLNKGSAQTEQYIKDSLEIERIYILPEYQGSGLGGRLVEQSIEVAKREALSSIWLGAWEKNPGAIKFYERHGFVAFDRHTFSVGNDEQEDVMMRLQL